jgi:erythromycin esterase-like protein
MEKKTSRLIILASFAFLWCLTATGQDNAFADFSRLKLEPISNLNWQDDHGQDIAPIKNLFVKNNLVILAENTHFEGAVRDAQCVILKELIERETINTIYLEQVWMNINKINSILKEKGKAGIEETYQYLTPLLFYWHQKDFWNYLANKIIEGKVELVGFDISGIKSELVIKMFEDALELPAIQKSFPMYNDEWRLLWENYWNLDLNYHFAFPEYNYRVQKKFTQAVQKEYALKNEHATARQWKMVEFYYDWVYRRQFAIKRTKKFPDFKKFIREKTAYYSYRDTIMAEILLSHYQGRRGVKAIAIMSAFHALNNFRHNREIEKCCVEPTTYVMNEQLHKSMPDSIYSICFVAASGAWGDIINDTAMVIQLKPAKYSIETYFKNSTSYKYFFTDLQSANITAAFPSAIIFGNTYTADWAQIYQGLIFVREQYPLIYKLPPPPFSVPMRRKRRF